MYEATAVTKSRLFFVAPVVDQEYFCFATAHLFHSNGNSLTCHYAATPLHQPDAVARRAECFTLDTAFFSPSKVGWV